MPKHGKRYRALLEKIDPNKVYSIEEAAKLIPEIKSARFDETVEAHIKLGIDARKSDQNVRSTVALPHGTGRSVRVLAIAKGDKIIEARDAGADIAAGEEIIPEILAGRSDFDAVVATPDVMGAVGSKLGRVLGPRGLLPNPKAGTVGFNIAEIVRARSKLVGSSSATTRPGWSTLPSARPASPRTRSPRTCGLLSGRWRGLNPRAPRGPSCAPSTSPPPWAPRSG